MLWKICRADFSIGYHTEEKTAWQSAMHSASRSAETCPAKDCIYNHPFSHSQSPTYFVTHPISPSSLPSIFVITSSQYNCLTYQPSLSQNYN